MSELLETRFRIINDEREPQSFSYYEYKYLVPHENLTLVKDILQEFYGGTDPFPCGVVDSIYYDTQDETLFQSCINGEAQKRKYRIRGYGNGEYRQIHEKGKDLAGVAKYKSAIQVERPSQESAPHWDSLQPLKENSASFSIIRMKSCQFGPLYPSIRVQYYRYRYRSYDYRFTLDTNIEVFALKNGLSRVINYGVFPYHVLEIKTEKLRPKLPFIGLIKLSQVSCSKFMLGIKLLNGYEPF